MFRYFGISWDPVISAQAAMAQQLEESIQSEGNWQAALIAPGLHVYTTGSQAGVNGIYPIPHDHGVILGRLFRQRSTPSGAQDIEISAKEGEQIFQTHGRALIDDYWGRYVAILRNGEHGAVLLRDPSGTLPCFLSHINGAAVFFSWLEDVFEFSPFLPTQRVNWEAVSALLAIDRLGGRSTALEGVLQILPGQPTPVAESTLPKASLWSAVAFARTPLDPEIEIAAKRLRNAVVDCSLAWLSCYQSILVRLSGGVDSAILLGSLSPRNTTTKLTCLNYYSPGSDSDERSFARLAASRAGVELVERERDSGFRIDDILTVGRTPTPETYLGRIGTGSIDAEVADMHRARAMFTGIGGDQLFFQLRCTWPAADYLSMNGLGRGFIRASLVAARLGRVSLWQSMRNAFTDRHHQTSPLDGAWRFNTLASRREALDGSGHLDRYVHPDLLCAADLPIGKFHQVEALINPLGYYDPYLREAAPELVCPLLSQPVMELCLTLPTWLLTHGGSGRALARKAFAQDLPREIATRQSKGGMEEHVAAILQRNLSFARSLLLDGHLVKERLLDRKKVEAALAGRLSSLGGYLGEIHKCMAIEAWLQRVTASRNQ